VINSSSGYQLVSSSLAMFKPQSEISNRDSTVGSIQKLSELDRGELHGKKGSISANLMSILVSGNITTMGIQVTNTGDNPEKLELFGIHGDFSWGCSSRWNEDDHHYDRTCEDGPNEVVFLPGEPHIVTTTVTTTASGCAPRHISLVNATDIQNNLENPIIMNPGQCLMFSFSGTILSRDHVVVPMMNSDEKFVVHVFADDADSKLDCHLQQSSSPSCSVDHDNNGSD
jgi:hypothetical protein